MQRHLPIHSSAPAALPAAASTSAATLLAAALLWTSCTAAGGSSDDPQGNEPAAASQPQQTGALEGPRLDDPGYDYFGAGVAAGREPVPVADVVADPDAFTGEPMQMRAADGVAEVCKKKGCWMNVGPEGQRIRVTFKDYGFFVPKDCEGREVIVEGRFSVEEVSVEDRRHYLEDAGNHDEAAKVTEPGKELRFVATGVAMRKS